MESVAFATAWSRLLLLLHGFEIAARFTLTDLRAPTRLHTADRVD